MMTPEWIRALVTILGGSLAGGLTNSLAVWMLFHPYEPPRLGPFRLSFLHGAIPKNQARLARAVGRTVGTRLLNEEDLERTFSSEPFRAAFEARFETGIHALLTAERGSLRSHLPESFHEELDTLLDAWAEALTDRVEGWMASPAFAESLSREAGRILDGLEHEPLGNLLTPDRESALAEALEGWFQGAVEGEAFEAVVDESLARGSVALLQPERSLEELLPQGLSSSLERALSSYLPVVVHRLGRLLEDPVARVRVEAALHDLFQRMVRDLRFHQRVVARLVVTDETLDRVLTTIQEEGAERVSEMLRDPEVQRALAKGVNDAVVELLRRPVTEVLGQAGDANVLQARATLRSWVLSIARDPETVEFLSGRLRGGLSRISEATWGDLLRRIPRERLVEGVLGALRGPGTRSPLRDTIRRLLGELAARPIGRPSDWLPLGSAHRIQGWLSPVVWRWLQGQTPAVIRTLDVERRVEEKVLKFPTPELEAMVRRVTERELRLIVRLGYVLGAMIGAILVAAQWLIE